MLARTGKEFLVEQGVSRVACAFTLTSCAAPPASSKAHRALGESDCCSMRSAPLLPLVEAAALGVVHDGLR